MKGKFKIVIATLGWCAIAAYLVFASGITSEAERYAELTRMEINVRKSGADDPLNVDIISRWLESKGFTLTNGTPVSEVNTEELSRILLSHGFVSGATVYTDLDGKLNIEVSQRRPVGRVKTSTGYDFYLSADGQVMDAEGVDPVRVPLVTGNIVMPFPTDYFGPIGTDTGEPEKKAEESYIFLGKLINFVRLIGEDSFWNSQIVQINITERPGGRSADLFREPEVELVPRVGRHVILVGSLDDAASKLDKLKLFYDKALRHEGWDSYSTIDLKYKGQVVCTK